MELLINKYHQHKETLHNFIWRSLQIFGKQGIIFLIFILSAKLLTPYEFGIYNYLLAIIFLLIMFGDFGISTATSKYVAEYNATDKEKLKSVLFNSGIIILGLTLIITVLTIIIGPLYLKDKYAYILYLLPLIFLAPITSLYDGIYRGLKQFKKLAIISLIVGILSLGFVYILIKQYGLMGALVSQVLFYFILVLALASGYREFRIKWDKNIAKKIFKYSFVLGVAGASYFLYARANTIILGHFGYIVEAGYYELINKTFLILTFPFMILAQVVAPNIAGWHSKKKISKVLHKYKKYLILSFLTSMILAITLYLFLPIILETFLPEYYTPSIILMSNLLLVVLITQSVAAIASTGFSTATGHGHINMYFLLVFGLINLPLSILLVKSYGFIGVVYSTIAIRLTTDILFSYTYYRIIKKETKDSK